MIPAQWCQGHVDEDELYCRHHIQMQRADQPQLEDRAQQIDRFTARDAEWARLLNVGLNDAMNVFFRNDPRREDAVFGNPFGRPPDPGVDMMRARLLPPPRAGIPDHIFFAEPPPVPRLRAIAIDNQNVHTTEVSTQTNDAVQKLLAIQVDPSQHSRAILFTAWNQLPGDRDEKVRVATDVDRHFQLRYCRTQPPQPPDELYRKMVRGLVAYINRVEDNEIRQSLWQRMYEECRESLEMCIDGHISRLANVLVGFDEAFKSPISQGELIQNRISAISGMPVSHEEKTRLATTFFEEIALPADQRVAWLEALAE